MTFRKKMKMFVLVICIGVHIQTALLKCPPPLLQPDNGVRIRFCLNSLTFCTRPHLVERKGISVHFTALLITVSQLTPDLQSNPPSRVTHLF